MHEHGHLPLRVDAKNFRMLRLVEPFHLEGHHDEVEVETLLARGDLGLRAEHAQRAGVKDHSGVFGVVFVMVEPGNCD